MSLSATIQGTNYAATLVASRSLTLESDHISGVEQIAVATSPQQAGTPCTINVSISGIR